ncbi:DUF4367 domain-containing protein [Peribacillus tepidiphilus]|jgi:hypothetical protein|uniref:DUF4367 domain-containing protein n=1 Tax=Peribacillus tepidiphilus TaxID=2652445 RepID=UPI0012929885|nr:DUF4367 domain-containing protein [Peribacillus tepidiphilus]
MKKLLIYISLGGIILLTVLIFNTYSIKFPVNWAQKLVNIKVETEYIPIQYENNYATIRNCGRNCAFIKVFYEGSKERIVITATNYVSWGDDPKWDKDTILPGTSYYYQNRDGKQLLFWRQEELELELEYSGKKIPKEELIKIADSVKVKRKKL